MLTDNHLSTKPGACRLRAFFVSALGVLGIETLSKAFIKFN